MVKTRRNGTDYSLMKRLFLGTFCLFLVTSLAIIFVAVPVYIAHTLPSDLRLTEGEFGTRTPLHIPHAKFIGQTTNYDAAVGEEGSRHIDLKLFGLVKIKRIKIDLLPFDEVIAGGHLIGFIAKTDGVVVTADSNINKLKKGDIMRQLGDHPIQTITDFESALESLPRDGLIARVIRGDKEFETKLQTDGSGKRLGLWLKDETSGIGTLTYINPQNNNFASLGHRLNDFETGVNVDVVGGRVYTTNIIAIEPSEGKRVGGYKSALRQITGLQGSILTSNMAGVFGCLNANSILLEDKLILPVASRYNVKPGKAKIRTTIDDGGPREFDAEIIKTRYQKKPGTKSMIIRITDRDLLDATGGIIHGMSGSPIIQNGKIVGALTHVVLGDASKGYGIYIDFIIP